MAQELGNVLPVDPINKLGPCGEDRFYPLTCWDEKAKQFADPGYLPPADKTSLPTFTLPVGSRAYVYLVSPDGLSYNLFSMMQTNFINNNNSVINNPQANRQPRFLGANLAGFSGHEYIGYVRIADPDNDALTVSIDTGGTAWNQWSAAPTISLASPENVRLYADWAGLEGNYNFSLTINDGRGEPNSTATKNFTIVIKNTPPKITAENITYLASTTNPLNYHLTAVDDALTYPLTFNFTPDPVALYGLNAPTFNMMPVIEIYDFHLGGFFNPSLLCPTFTCSFPMALPGFTIDITDSFGALASRPIVITVTNNRPQVLTTSNCLTSVRRNHNFPACTIQAVDSDNHLISFFTYNNLPGNLKPAFTAALPWNSSMTAPGSTGGFASSNILQASNGNYNIEIRAIDEYHAESPAIIHNLRVLTYCGDGERQSTNTEGRGGPSDNGQEQCDGTSNLPANTCDTLGGNRRYNCTAGCPDTGACPNTCAYTGGYCGDGSTQGAYGEECDDGNNSNRDRCDVRRSAPGSSGCCQFTRCGDGVTQDPNGEGMREACDGSADCTPQCRKSSCGDGFFNPLLEQCDETASGGSNVPTGECNENCLITFCGDTIPQAQNGMGTEGTSDTGDEECDDGNYDSTDGCDHHCRIVPICSVCEFDNPLATFDNCCIQ